MIFDAFLKVIVIVQAGADAVTLKFLSTEPDKAFNLIMRNRLSALIDDNPGFAAGEGAAETLKLGQG